VRVRQSVTGNRDVTGTRHGGNQPEGLAIGKLLELSSNRSTGIPRQVHGSTFNLNFQLGWLDVGEFYSFIVQYMSVKQYQCVVLNELQRCVSHWQGGDSSCWQVQLEVEVQLLPRWRPGIMMPTPSRVPP
jgi:hypothetical protein